MLKNAQYIIGFILILLITIILSISIITSLGNTELTNSLKNNKEIITSIVSLINLLFVVSVFIYTILREKGKKNNERKEFWVRKLTTEKKIFQVIEFFEDTIYLLKKIELHENDIEKWIEIVKQKWDKCVCEFTDLIRIVDKGTAQTLDDCLLDCYDELTLAGERVLVNEEDVTNVINDCKVKFNKYRITFLIYLYKLDSE